MFNRKKKRLDEITELAKSFSWWTPIRKFFAAAAVAVTLGAGGTWFYTHESGRRVLADHNRHVETVTAQYKGRPSPARTIEACLTTGNDLTVLTDSFILYSEQMPRSAATMSDTARRQAGLCIRNTDGGQDIALESIIRMTGLTYGEVDGILRYSTRINIVPRVPDVFPYDFDIRTLTIGDTVIPQDYITEAPPDNGIPFKHYTIDIVRLVEEDMIGSDDFEDGLNITINADLSIEDVPDIEPDTVLGMDAYGSLPAHFLRYTVAGEDLPKDHPRIREIVERYEGSSDNVLDIIDYALQYTDDTLDYCTADNSNCPDGRYLPIPEILDQGGGVCAGYAELFITLCRSFGIPARYVTNNTFNTATGDISGRHAWAEVALPLDDGSYRWVTVEPTWADNNADPGSYINFTTPRYMYDISFDVELETRNRAGRYGILQETHWDSTAREREEQEEQEGPPEDEEDMSIGLPGVFIEVRIEDIDGVDDGDEE